jgi:hypothetical protein
LLMICIVRRIDRQSFARLAPRSNVAVSDETLP